MKAAVRAQPQRLLADEPERDCAQCAQQPLLRRTRSSGHECHSCVNGIEDLRSLTAWTECSGVKAIWIALYYPEQAQGNGLEPPCTEPYAGWCGTRELITPGDPIVLLFVPLVAPTYRILEYLSLAILKSSKNSRGFMRTNSSI